MKQPKVTATWIVKNEDKWIWYSIKSVIKYADNILVYDTGSTDNTVKIIESINNPKITLKLKGLVNSKEFVKLRQQQLEEIDSDWFLVVDGDEVYPEDTIKSLSDEINKAQEQTECIATRFYNCVGDVYHHNPKGNYNILGNLGNLTIRAIRRNIEGLHYGGLYLEGTEGLFDGKGVLIQDRERHIKLLNKYYFHMHSLCRSSANCPTMRRDKIKEGRTYHFGVGKPFDENVALPEVFFAKRPPIVPNATERLPSHISMKNFMFHLYHKVAFETRRGSNKKLP